MRRTILIGTVPSAIGNTAPGTFIPELFELPEIIESQFHHTKLIQPHNNLKPPQSDGDPRMTVMVTMAFLVAR
jgi:hypothetical protein